MKSTIGLTNTLGNDPLMTSVAVSGLSPTDSAPNHYSDRQHQKGTDKGQQKSSEEEGLQQESRSPASMIEDIVLRLCVCENTQLDAIMKSRCEGDNLKSGAAEELFDYPYTRSPLCAQAATPPLTPYTKSSITSYNPSSASNNRMADRALMVTEPKAEQVNSETFPVCGSHGMKKQDVPNSIMAGINSEEDDSDTNSDCSARLPLDAALSGVSLIDGGRNESGMTMREQHQEPREQHQEPRERFEVFSASAKMQKPTGISGSRMSNKCGTFRPRGSRAKFKRELVVCTDLPIDPVFTMGDYSERDESSASWPTAPSLGRHQESVDSLFDFDEDDHDHECPNE